MDKDQNRSHFKIPVNNISNEELNKTGYGETYERDNYSEHGMKLKAQTGEFIQKEQTKKDFEYTSDFFVEIETPEDISIKEQRNNIEKLGFEFFSYDKVNSFRGLARIKKEKIPFFRESLDRYISTPSHRGRSYISGIEKISSIPPERKIESIRGVDLEEKLSIVINLFNVLEIKERMGVVRSIIDELSKYTDDISRENFANGVASIACELYRKNIPEIVSDFSTIKEIKPNQTFFVENSMPLGPLPNPINLEKVESDSTICIIDSGIRTGNEIFDPIVKKSFQYLPPRSKDCSFDHGTFVASRCAFGDSVDECLGTHKLSPYCNLLDIAIFGVDSTGKQTNPTEFQVRRIIEDVVLKHHNDVKVYNLSLGSSFPIKDDQYTELAKLLDFLSREYKILFVVSAGNINDKLGDYPKDHFSNENARIGGPAESLLSISVGSIAKYNDSKSLSDRDQLSPFSRIGPGADGGVKPELVTHGGNLISPYTASPRVSTYGISSDCKEIAVNNGTSFATPLVSQYAQRLFDLYPDSNPNLIKALLYHFSEVRNIYDELEEPKNKYVGFGEPNLENAIRAQDNNAAYIYEGELDQNNYQYISFHVPKTLAEDTNSKLNLRITITYDPPVDTDNEIEYSQTRISAKIIKPSNDGYREVSVPKEDKYFLQWNPTIQLEKRFSRAYNTGEWRLRLRLYTRGGLEDDFLQDYSVVIEIIDDNSNTDVYNDLIKEYGTIYQVKSPAEAA